MNEIFLKRVAKPFNIFFQWIPNYNIDIKFKEFEKSLMCIKTIINKLSSLCMTQQWSQKKMQNIDRNNEPKLFLFDL